ncbi:MAG: BA14K family protein [Rhizobiaceae bacterium]|jgi:hypothetical protein|nr:BA14K family protein [Rhizobiaceae bacterium]
MRNSTPVSPVRTGIAALLAAALALPLASPQALANDVEWYGGQHGGQHGGSSGGYVEGGPSYKRFYRDEIGRFYIRHGQRIYVQYWDHDVNPEIDDHGGTIHHGGWNGDWEENVAPAHPPVRKKRNKQAEAAIIAGIAGLAIGAIVGGVQQQTRPVVAQPVRPVTPPQLSNAYPPRPAAGPHVVTVNNAFEPWTPAWHDWCRNRYRSFNPASGTFTGYDGVKRFCVVK